MTQAPIPAAAAALHCPEELHYLMPQQTWARLHPDGTATVGITDLGVRLSGDIFMCRPQRVGTEVAQGRSIAVVELAKSVVSVKSPVTGQVLEINPLLETRPELVHRDPYGQGWLARLHCTNWQADAAQLLHGPEVLPAMQHHAWLNREDLTLR